AYVPVRDIGFDLDGSGLGAKPHPRPQPEGGAPARGVRPDRPVGPELRPILEQAFDEGEPGTVYVINRYRDASKNLRTQMLRIVRSIDRKSTRLNSSHVSISYAVFCLKKKRYCSLLRRRHWPA